MKTTPSYGRAACGECNRSYTRKKPHQKFCSTSCRTKNWNRKKYASRSLIDLEKRIKVLEDRMGIPSATSA